MDADEALARYLQAQEAAAAAAAHHRTAAQHNLRGAASASAEFAGRVEAGVKKVMAYEDELAQAMALSVIPLTQLEAAAEEACAVSAAMGDQPPLARQDALSQELLMWFKKDFFHWVNNPPCNACGSGNTHNTSHAAPTAEEAAYGAGRTEIYRCGQCGAITRFARFNDPVKLLETRRGRCGEWANCFMLCCRTVGLEARVAMDWEDHIWGEYWSEAWKKWVHCDPCEAAFDRPLLYEVGWGKPLSYVIAIGRHGVADVTRRYTRQHKELQRRRGLVSEEWLVGFLGHVTARLRAGLSPEQRRELEQRDSQDRESLLTNGGQLATAEDTALPGRQTGDAAWLAARGEDGSNAARAAAAVPPPGTLYRLAKDEGLQAGHPRRLCGGAVRASGENSPREVVTCAFDGSPHSKWLDFSGKQGNAWLEYRLPAERPAVVLGAYALTSANDSPERDPRHVVLEAWAEDMGAWVALDEQRSLSFPQRHHRLLLRLGGGGPPSRRFRLRVTAVADPAAANSVQLACLDLYTHKGQQQQEQQQVELEVQQQTAAKHAVQHLAGLSLQAEQQLQPLADSGPPSGQLLPPQQRVEQPEVPAAAAPAPADSGQPAGEPENPWAALFVGVLPN